MIFSGPLGERREYLHMRPVLSTSQSSTSRTDLHAHIHWTFLHGFSSIVVLIKRQCFETLTSLDVQTETEGRLIAHNYFTCLTMLC
jgi:hypothetical protein